MMENFRFDRKLQEAALRKSGKQPTVIIDGRERKVRCPAFIGTGIADIPCLVKEGSKTGNTGYSVVAVSFDSLDEKEKIWVCIQPVFLERAIRFFIENHQMESMTGDCRCANRLANTRDIGFDFETENVCIEIKVLIPVTVGTGSCTWKSFHEAVKQMIGHCNNPAVKEKGKRILLLIVCQDGTGQMQSMEDGSIKDELKKAVSMGIEFWMAETKTEEDGISLLSYKNFTDNMLKE